MREAGDERLRKRDRLRKRREYLVVQNRGKKYHQEHFLAFVLPSTGRGRFGITVSAKIGNAVTRNRVKRLLREVLRRARSDWPGDRDVVLVAKRSAAETSYEALLREFVALGRRLRG